MSHQAPSMPPIYHHQIIFSFCSIIASKCISKLPQSQPLCPSLSSLNHGHQVYLSMPSIITFKFAQNWHHMCNSNLMPSQPTCFDNDGLQMHPETHCITACECISNLTRSQPRCTSQSSLNCNLQVNLELLSSSVCSHFRYTRCR
jgi:hypothetical protein